MATSRSEHLKLTYEDYARLPDDGKRHQIIDGRHYVSPAPNLYHQELLGRIFVQLHLAIAVPRLGRVFLAPTDVELSRHDIVQPDLSVVLAAREPILAERGIQGAPDLAIEILSPSTRRLDRKLKRELYERAQVREYWIVDPEARTVEQHVLVGERYGPPSPSTEHISLQVLEGVTIDLTQVW